jgi:DNA-binding response OmpR family regulator
LSRQDTELIAEIYNECECLEYPLVDTSFAMDRKSESITAHILVVDDDAELCRLVSRFLGAEGYSVQTVQSSRLGIEGALSGDYDLVVLDVMLPEMDGFEVLRRMRAQSSTPVLMLTARGDDLDRILGLEMGADDYLPKPFNTRELSARVRAILRRANSARGSLALPGAGLMRIGDLELNAGARTVRCGDHMLNLTTVEFDLLQRLLRSAGSVVGREELTKDVLGREFSPFDRSIDTHVWSLRRKVGNSLDGTERIKGIRGVGYLYALPDRSGGDEVK